MIFIFSAVPVMPQRGFGDSYAGAGGLDDLSRTVLFHWPYDGGREEWLGKAMGVGPLAHLHERVETLTRVRLDEVPPRLGG